MRETKQPETPLHPHAPATPRVLNWNSARSCPPALTHSASSLLNRTDMTWLQWPAYARDGAPSTTQGKLNSFKPPKSSAVTTCPCGERRKEKCVR